MAGDNLTSDADLLVYEPNIFALRFQHQLLVEGADGATDSAGTTLTSAGSDFVTAGVEAGHVVYLAASTSTHEEGRVYPVASDPSSATQLALSTAMPGSLSGVSFAIYHFDDQHEQAMYDLFALHGFNANDEGEDRLVTDVLNTDQVKPVVCYRVLQLIYEGIAAGRERDSVEWEKAKYYDALYRKWARLVSIEWDTDDDGYADMLTFANQVEVRRH